MAFLKYFPIIGSWLSRQLNKLSQFQIGTTSQSKAQFFCCENVNDTESCKTRILSVSKAKTVDIKKTSWKLFLMKCIKDQTTSCIIQKSPDSFACRTFWSPPNPNKAFWFSRHIIEQHCATESKHEISLPSPIHRDSPANAIFSSVSAEFCCLCSLCASYTRLISPSTLIF